MIKICYLNFIKFFSIYLLSYDLKLLILYMLGYMYVFMNEGVCMCVCLYESIHVFEL